MANMKAMYVPSTTPGKHWKIVAFKASNDGMVNATEGELKDEGEFTVFSFTMFEARRRSWVVGRMTAKNIITAWRALIASMKADGLINPDEADEVPPLHIVGTRRPAG